MRAVRIHQRGNSCAITIPTTYMKDLGWHLGQLLVLVVHQDELHAFALQDLAPNRRGLTRPTVETAHEPAQT